MNTPKFMVLFHLFFLLLGMLSLFLMASNFVPSDWLAYWIIAMTVFLNLIFGILWMDEFSKEKLKEQKPLTKIGPVYPMVSFIAPAYNKETNIMRCVNSLFKCAVEYRGPSEIIIVDDGSTDNTFEVAWTTIDSKQKELAHIRAKVVRHMATLGKAEALRTGVNKAKGEYIVIVDAENVCDPAELTDLVDYICATERVAVTSYIHPAPSTVAVAPGTIGIYRAEALRMLLNEKKSVTGDLEHTLAMQTKKENWLQ